MDGIVKRTTRQPFVMFMIGHNRTGKTVLALDFIKAYKNKFPKKEVIAFDPQSRIKNAQLGDHYIQKEDWAKYFDPSGELLIHDKLFVLDDYKALMDSDRTDPDFLRMLMLRNEKGLDFLFITHSPKLIVERISYYITHYALFYTYGDSDAFKSSKKVQNIETIAQCREFINAYVKKHDRGSYYEKDENGNDTSKVVKSFPFAFIDTEEEVISLINMPKADINNHKINF